MSKEKVVLLSHYDLDGAGCSVLSDHIWDVVDRKHQGYPKVRKSLSYLIGEYSEDVDTIVIADLKIELDDLLMALIAFKNVIYYDHHESSEYFATEEFQKAHPNFECHFSLDLCSTALMWIDGVKNKGAKRTPQLDAFMNMVDTYDLWHTEKARWNQSIILNDFFWHLHMRDFRKRFKDGFSGYTDDELVFAANLHQSRINVIERATVEEMESGSKVVVVEESKAINFVSSVMEGDVFYIIAPDWAKTNVSVRIKDDVLDNFNVNDGISELPIRYPKFVKSAGGHAAAGGINFHEHLSINDIVDVLYEHDLVIRGEFCGAGT